MRLDSLRRVAMRWMRRDVPRCVANNTSPLIAPEPVKPPPDRRGAGGASRPKTGQESERAPKRPPRAPPKPSAQDNPKTTHEAPKLAQEGSKTSPRREEGVRKPKTHAFSFRKAPGGPRGPKDALICIKKTLPQDAPRDTTIAKCPFVRRTFQSPRKPQ